eukprot:7824919-Pyramimonas_sp.AAC.1
MDYRGTKHHEGARWEQPAAGSGGVCGPNSPDGPPYTELLEGCSRWGVSWELKSSGCGVVTS